MIKTLLTLSILFPLASAIGYAVDFQGPANLTQLKCLGTSGYGIVMTRVFTNDGQIDKNGLATMNLIQKNKLNMNTYAYMTPQANVGNGTVQVDKMYNAMMANGIQFHTFYIQVSLYSASWSQDFAANTQFLLDLCHRASYYGKSVGFYTTLGDWAYITGNVKTLVPNLVLWYSDVYGPGVTGESKQDFNDFVAFGPFKKSMVRFKQFGMAEGVCGVQLNRDIVAAN